jgi:SHS2 domain-containing protein
MAFRLVENASGVEGELSAATLHGLMEAASDAFTAAVTSPGTVEPRQAEELELDAPDLDSLLADFLSELLYRFDARRWLTRFAEIEVHEKDGGWSLEGTLRGERRDRPPDSAHAPIAAVAVDGLQVVSNGEAWTATVVFTRGRPEA